MSLLIKDRIRIVCLLSTKTLSGSLIEIAGNPVRDDNAHEQMNRFIRRCRFIAHTADLSALIYINDEQVGEMKMKTQPGKFTIALPVST